MRDDDALALSALVLAAGNALVDGIHAGVMARGYRDVRPAHGFAFARLAPDGATVSELAAHLQMSEEEVLEGLESANAYSTVSLDAPDSGDEDAPAVADSLGMVDDALEGVEYRESLKPLLEQLPPREKKILLLRFFGNMTQSQIAAELGISQMHVSRLLARTLTQLRDGLTTDD